MSFRGDLDPASAERPANYRLVPGGRGRRPIVQAADYHEQTRTVTLVPRGRPIRSLRGARLTLQDGLRDASGRLWDGDGDGQPGRNHTAQIDPAETVDAILRGEEPCPAMVIKPTGVTGIDLISGSKRATRLNVPAPHEADPNHQYSIREFLDEVKGAYDMVLVDRPPNLHLCSWDALIASDHLIVPLKPEDYRCPGDHRRPGVGRPGALRAEPVLEAPGLLDHDDGAPQEYP